MPDRLGASTRLVGRLASTPAPIVSIRQEDRVLTVIVVWGEPVADRIAGAQLHHLAAAAELASEGRSWTIAVEAPPTPMNDTGWRWASIVLVPPGDADAEFDDAPLVLDSALHDLVGRVQHGQ